MCKISIIVPTFNSGKYLKEAIDSMLKQTIDDYEIIIIDDSTTDEVKTIIESFSNPKIKYITGPKKGISAALNVGIDNSKGEYIARMDADDISMPDRLKKESDYLDNHPDVGVCGMLAETLFMDGRPPTIWGKERIYDMETPGIIDQLMGTPAVCHPTAMFRKKIFDQYRLRYNEEYRTAEDQELWIRALKITKFHNIMEVGLRYRVHRNNTSTIKNDEGEKNALLLKYQLMKWLLPSGNYNLKEIEKQSEYILQIMQKKGIWFELGNDESEEDIILTEDDKSSEELNIKFKADNNEIEPWTEDSIPIIMSSSHSYVPYLCVSICSIAKTSCPNKKYEVHILNSSITEEDEKLIKTAITDCNNVSIKFIRVSDYIYGYRFHTRGHVSEESFFRMIIPDLFKKYSKVIWIDVDTIVLKDLDALYNTDISDYCLAAVIDSDFQGQINGGKKEVMEYVYKKLNMNDPTNYFQAGVLLLNLDKIRTDFAPLELVNACNKKKYFYADQDVLNILMESKVRYLDYRWNVLHFCDGWREEMIINYTPDNIRNDYLESRKDPWVIHYAGSSKPWNNPKDDFADMYWDIVWKSPFYKIIIEKMITNLIKNYPELEQFVDKYRNVNNHDSNLQCYIFDEINNKIEEIERKRNTIIRRLSKKIRHDAFYLTDCLREYGVITTTKIVVNHMISLVSKD